MSWRDRIAGIFHGVLHPNGAPGNPRSFIGFKDIRRFPTQHFFQPPEIRPLPSIGINPYALVGIPQGIVVEKPSGQKCPLRQKAIDLLCLWPTL